jgi:hypothetical protein
MVLPTNSCTEEGTTVTVGTEDAEPDCPVVYAHPLECVPTIISSGMNKIARRLIEVVLEICRPQVAPEA